MDSKEEQELRESEEVEVAAIYDAPPDYTRDEREAMIQDDEVDIDD